MSGSPSSNDLTGDQCDNYAGIPGKPCPPLSCLKPAQVCPAPMPNSPQQGRQGQNQSRQGRQNNSSPTSVAAMLNAAKQSASAPPSSASASSSSIGSGLTNLPTSRIIASKEITKTIVLPHSGTDAEQNTVSVTFSKAELAQKLGGTYNGVSLTPERAILSGLHLEVDNDCQYGVVIAIPGFVNSDCHAIGSELGKGPSGACVVPAGRSRKENLLADEAVIEDRSVTSLATVTPKQLLSCEHTGLRGEWTVYAKMEVGNKYINNPVLEQMYNAQVIDKNMWASITAMHTTDTVPHIDKSVYDTYKSQLLAHAHSISSRLTDLTSIQLLVQRDDGLNFNKPTEFLQKVRGVHGDELRQKFENVPGQLHLRMSFEFASDAISE